jgi:prepilin-type N-terminal cleavage/methylation domain-containing protein
MNATADGQHGFTIIEVVLVLAIAGLIFLMVFLALPALQRSQRNTARKQDVGIVASAINSYSSDNKGKLPDAGTCTSDGSSGDKYGSTGFCAYIDSLSSNSPTVTIQTSGSGKTYSEVIGTDGTNSTKLTTGKIIVVEGAACASDNVATSELVAGSARQSAVITAQEGGSDGLPYCQTV